MTFFLIGKWDIYLLIHIYKKTTHRLHPSKSISTMSASKQKATIVVEIPYQHQTKDDSSSDDFRTDDDDFSDSGDNYEEKEWRIGEAGGSGRRGGRSGGSRGRGGRRGRGGKSGGNRGRDGRRGERRELAGQEEQDQEQEQEQDQDQDQDQEQEEEEVEVDFAMLKRRGRHEPEVMLDQDASFSPLSLFFKFFDEAMLQVIVENTNAYALSKNAGEGRPWVNLVKEELLIFLSILIYLGLHQVKALEDLWNYDPCAPIHQISQEMTLMRFQQIKRYLHISEIYQDR